MPPKRKGQNLRGKDKLFRNAVEHVHVGVGHTVLGDVSLHLAAGSAKHTHTATATGEDERPAFYLELNEQLLSHSSKDFKKFRYEVLDLCETRALMNMSHRRIAEKLLLCLLDRSGGAVGNRAKSKATKTIEGKGETGEGFAAFVRLTIAFARDMGPKFFPYFEVFHQAVHAGLFDRRGFLIADTSRVQLVFAAQAAWCRELTLYWCQPGLRRLVERALGVYVALLSDSRGFVRRLAAELLAYVCRLAHPLLPLVVEKVAAELLDDYQRYALRRHIEAQSGVSLTAPHVSEASQTDEKDDDGDDEKGAADEGADALADASVTRGEADEQISQVMSSSLFTALPSEIVWNEAQSARYAKEVLRNHPVTESLGVFASELTRGIRGALSSSFEYFYLSLLECGLLLPPSEKAKVLAHDEVFMAAFGYEHMEESSASGEEIRKEAHTGIHAGRYRCVFARTSVVEAADTTQAADTPSDALDATAVPVAQELVRALMSLALQVSVQAVLREVRVNSTKQVHSDSEGTLDDGQSEDAEDVRDTFGDDNLAADESSAADAATITGGGHQRASTRLLHAVTAALVVSSVHHIHILNALLTSSYYYLWQDRREIAVLRRLGETLVGYLKSSARAHYAVPVVLHGALLEMLVPLCVTPYLCHPMALRRGVADAAAAHANDAHTLAVQKAFLPLGREVVQQLLRLASGACGQDGGETMEAARVTLYAFAQDVLHKQFAFYIAEERRATEEGVADRQPGFEADTAPYANKEGRDANDDDDEEDDDPEDDYVPDDHDGGDGALGSLMSGKRLEARRRTLAARQAAKARAREAQSAEVVLKIKPLLTPLALTLLHALCSGYWSLANSALERRLATLPTSSAAVEADADVEALASVLAARHVERAVLLVRLTHDRTRHAVSSPLQQLLRLKASSASSSSSTAAGLALRACVETMFSHLMHLFMRRTEQLLRVDALQTTPSHTRTPRGTTAVAKPRAPRRAVVHLVKHFENEMELLACGLPALRDLLAVARSGAETLGEKAATHTATDLQAPLHKVLEVVRRCLDRAADITSTSEPSALSLISPSSGYALYGQVASVLIYSGTGAALDACARTVDTAVAEQAETDSEILGKRGKRVHKARAVGAPSAAVFAHLAQAIHLLATAFDAGKKLTATSLTGPGGASAFTTSHTLSESERGQLMYATQVLLRSLLWSLGLPEDAHTAGARLSDATRRALRTLRQSLPDDCQAKLVQSILLECLVSPMQSLRLLTLRLLVWLCHRDVPVEDRLAGLSPVDTTLLIALVRAEEFNPLSATGNLDGLKHVLAKATFAAESGTLTDPFERCVLARAMMGLYYLKFSGAWAAATRILHGLVRWEQTTPASVFIKAARDEHKSEVDAHNEEDDESAVEPHGGGSGVRQRLEPVVWNTAIVPYAHLMVFGDVMALESRATVAEAEVTALTDDDDGDMDADNEEAVAATLTGTSAARADEMHLQARLDSWATYRCPYAITLTDQQQHEKGAVVSRAFSSMQYTDDIIAAVDLASADGELISWQSHWVAQRDESTASGYLARSTDRVTLAQTFLGALEEMMKHSSAFDSKLRLVEDLVMELVAMDRNEHPLTNGHTHVRRLDERLCLAMRACAAAPTTVLSAGQQQRAEATVLAVITSRNKTLESLFASYTANANARLQRAALDNLKRLKLEPFHAHHTQLIPYCDSLKGLFAFLSCFHLDTIPAHDRGDYVATAITICLPKLIAKVSKDKRRDQAVLQRRLMGFLTELVSLSSSAQGGAPASVDEVTQVLDRVTQRLVLSRVATTGELTDVDAFDFLGQWRTAVCEAQDRHAVRHLERQIRQLTHATRLLQSLLGAVGQRFASYVRSCLYLALQAYLVACRQHLREIVEARIDAITRTRQDKRERGESEDEEVRVQRWCEETLRALRTRGLSLAMTELRRTTVVVVVSLLEQFPSECIAVIEDMVDAAPADSDDPVRASIFGRYITALYANAKGVSQPSMPLQPDPAARAGVGKTVAKGTVTPMLRLLLAWSTREPLLPLIAAFGDEVTGTFAELFAVNPVYLEADQPTKLSARDGHRGAGMPPVHKAPAAAVYDALRCLSDLLARRDESLRVLGHRTTAVEEAAAAKKTAEKRRGKVVQPSRDHPRASTRHTVTLQEAFLATHVTTIFTAVYKLIMHGDDDDENDNNTNDRENEDSTHTGAGAAQPKKSAASTGGRFSVMAFSVPMWKEVIQTVSMLAQQMQRRAAATASTGAVTSAVEACEVQRMLGRLLEVSLKFVVHPMCITDAATVVMAVQVVRQLFTHLGRVDLARHYRPLVHLFNTVTNPEARLLLCDVAKAIVPKLALTSIAGVATGTESNDDAVAVREALAAQMAATARAVACLNSFDDNNDSLDRYDFDLRYHTFHSLQLFFANKGNYGARPAAQATKAHRGGTGTRDAVRHERDYSGELDVHLPVSKHTVPVLAIPAFQLLVANVMYFLRDPESTLRAQAVQLFYSMMRYAANALPVQGEDSTRRFDYAACVLEQVVRQGEVLSTLRHGVVSRDVHIRHDHMVCFGALGRHYASSFPSFHALCSSNTAQDFFQNVGHVQHKCRLHALALLRKLGSQMQLRDVLRVIVPFLMSAIKDFAQGKRDLQNMTDGRAKGYCDAVLHTIAALTEKMPWEAYYRVLTLFLSNAGANASLRMPMLRGVVQVLENFDFLDTEDGGDAAVAAATGRTKTTEGTTGGPDGGVEEDDDEDEDAIEDDDETVRAEVARRRRQFRHQRVLNVLEHDVLPQLLGFIGTGKEGQKTLGLTGELKGSNINTISSLRKEQEAEDKATSKTAILQLPVALAVTRIVKHFPEDRFDFYVDHLMDELVRKLRTKNDRHRDSARRILGAMLQETGPGKLRPIITKLQDNLVHGYQLHVLGYTVVTLLFQLYEPQAALVSRSGHHASLGTGQRHRHAHHADPVAEALEEVKKRRQEQQGSGVKHDGSDADNEEEEARENKHTSSSPAQDATLTEAEREDLAVETAEQELIDQLLPHATVFDHAYGVQCLTNLLDPLITIFLDDYLGEISEQKGQVELMSKMVEIKSSRAVQGFAFLARHAEATRMMDVFLQKVAWVLTPPSDSSVDVSSLHGSAKVKALMMHELRTKYVTVSKNASADLTFVNKVRLIAVRVARGLMMNPSMRVEQSFAQVRDLLTRHNATREEKILAFEAKDGTRRIRGNAHLVIHKAERATLREMRDKNFVVEPVPERVDVDFSAHTVLATQQRQKLRLYKGRYGRDLKEAAKDFYREDPATAVVLDTTDEFLLKYLLSVLKQVLGIGKERHYSKAAVQLDLLRHQHRKGTQGGADDDRDDTAAAAAVIVGEEHDNDEDREEMEVDKDGKDGSDTGEDKDANEDEDEDETALDPQDIDADGGDDLDEFAEAQAHYAGKADGEGRKGRTTAALLARHNLTAAFTREHRALLESLVPVVLHTLEGEGSDPVVGNALDCLLALVSLRPPLDTVHAIEANLLDTVAGFLMRGGAIKQRAMRVCAALICHQKFELTEDQAVRLVALARAEIIDRSEFLPMALSLFHAVLRKHIHVVEVYDLIDLVTELLVHLGAKRGIRYRCVQILVRFLTEFKLTPEKFRSHINLYCRNLDYPELSGTLALLELLDALAYRLPTVVLRDEAPVLLPPLAAVVLRGQWREARERAGQVIQHLVKLAGVDVLVPILSGWMDPAKPRPTREMAAQLWATMIPAIAAAYGLNDTDVANTLEDTNEAGDDAAGGEADTSSHLRESRDGFDQCCAWSLEAVLNGCLYNQYEAAGGRKAASGTSLTAKFKAKAEMKGWEHVFYSLRCAEALFVASPFRMYRRLGPALLPVLIDHLMLHTHPWVQAVSVRILRHYCYTFVEPYSGFLASDTDTLVAAVAEASTTGTSRGHSSSSSSASTLLVVPVIGAAPTATIAQLEDALRQAARALKQCLTRVAMSDVSNETYNAHRAINSPSRAESLKLMVFLLRTICVLVMRMSLLIHHAGGAPSARHASLAVVEKELRLVRSHLESVAKPVLRQGKVVNYMVRTASLVQLFGGLVSVLPTPSTTEDVDASHLAAVNEAATWLMGGAGLDVLRLVQEVAAPLVGIALRAANISDRLSTLAHQSASVMAEQLEARRPLLRKSKTAGGTATVGRKRGRSEEETSTTPSTPALDVVLGELTTHVAAVRQERRVKQITQDTRKSMKRNRREMDKNGSF